MLADVRIDNRNLQYRVAGAVIACLVVLGCSEPTISEAKVVCRSPNSDKKTKVYEWKYDAIKVALIAVIPTEEPGVEIGELRKLVTAVLPEDQVAPLGNIGWLTDMVRLDMEARGELLRSENSRKMVYRAK